RARSTTTAEDGCGSGRRFPARELTAVSRSCSSCCFKRWVSEAVAGQAGKCTRPGGRGARPGEGHFATVLLGRVHRRTRAVELPPSDGTCPWRPSQGSRQNVGWPCRQ